jgi:hypothetical protein
MGTFLYSPYLKGMNREIHLMEEGDGPIHLKGMERANPDAVLKGFFGTYTLEECRDIFWDIVSRSLCCTDEELGTHGRREILGYYEEAERLIEAAFLIFKKQTQI